MLTIHPARQNYQRVKLVGELIDFKCDQQTGYTEYWFMVDGRRVLVEHRLIPLNPPVVGRCYEVYAYRKVTAYSNSLEMFTYGEC